MPMKLRSKLDTQKYKMVPYDQWDLYLKFAPGVDRDEIDPCLLGRLAACSRDMKVALKEKWEPVLIISGFRTMQKAIELYKKSGGYMNSKGQWVGGNGTAAVPGTSWHMKRLAIDVGTAWLKAINKTEATIAQRILRQYGLFKPMTAGNGQTVLEDWHIQPIETDGVPRERRDALIPVI